MPIIIDHDAPPPPDKIPCREDVLFGSAVRYAGRTVPVAELPSEDDPCEQCRHEPRALIDEHCSACGLWWPDEPNA